MMLILKSASHGAAMPRAPKMILCEAMPQQRFRDNLIPSLLPTLPDRVTPTGELSQPTTTSVQPSFWMRAAASAALRPAAAMRPPVMPASGAMRPRWYATSTVCSRVRHPSAYPATISPAVHVPD